MEKVIWKNENGKMYMTSRKNKERLVMNWNEITNLEGFDSLEDAQQYLENLLRCKVTIIYN